MIYSVVSDFQPLQDLMARLSRLPARVQNEILIEAGRITAVSLETKIAIYPPALPESSYTRTGNLGKSINSSSILTGPGTVQVRLGADPTLAPYAPYVLDEDLQLDVHKGRWETIQESIEGQLDQTRDILVRLIDARIGAYLT